MYGDETSMTDHHLSFKNVFIQIAMHIILSFIFSNSAFFYTMNDSPMWMHNSFLSNKM